MSEMWASRLIYNVLYNLGDFFIGISRYPYMGGFHNLGGWCHMRSRYWYRRLISGDREVLDDLITDHLNAEDKNFEHMAIYNLPIYIVHMLQEILEWTNCDITMNELVEIEKGCAGHSDYRSKLVLRIHRLILEKSKK